MRTLLILVGVLLLSSCGSGRKPMPLYSDDVADVPVPTEVGENAQDVVEPTEPADVQQTEIISVPFTEAGGVKYVEVKINGTIGVDMILDSGCSSTLISVSEANYLYEKGVLTQDDVMGVSQAQIADGSIMENTVVNLKEVIIGGRIVCNDVEALVSSTVGGSLLLGNEVLNRAASYSVDNENKVINFHLR